MNRKKLTAIAVGASMLLQGAAALAAEPGDNIFIGTDASCAETQALIDNRPNITRQMEYLTRGLVAVKSEKSVFLSWRWLGTESLDVKYNLYRNGELLNAEPLNVTNYMDINAVDGAQYQVAPVTDGKEGEKCDPVSVMENNYFDIPIKQPPENTVNGEKYTYSPNDMSVGDLDGDGEYEYVLKWDPSNSKDAASSGYTGECIIDAYEKDGTRLWRINMGPNIRSGAHDTQFMVYDFDLDGKAEMICRTADGTIAGDGTVIGDDTKNYAMRNDGKNLQGPLFLTAFNGTDGSVIDTVDYYPQSIGDNWDISSWGDTWGNRSERYLAAIGYLDGEKPSALFCRGYYTGTDGPTGGRTCIAAYDLIDGKLTQKWVFDTMDYNNQYIGQGNHSMSTADVDYDGCDEIIYGALAVDNDGKPMYSTGLGHGDAQHVGDLLPDRPGLEVFSPHESSGAKYGYEMRDARTGEILIGEETQHGDVGRGASDDIDPRYKGAEMWSSMGVLVAADGTVISNKYTMAANFFAWWDGDLGREVQDGIYISKWNPETSRTDTIFTATDTFAINGTKANPALTADLFGDWREETIYPLKDYSALRVYTTTTPTGYRIPTLMHDIQYRNHVAIQNVCYNQPTHVSYYLGYDTETVPVPMMFTSVNGTKTENPDLSKKNWSINDLYGGTKVTLMEENPVALINGVPTRVENESTDVVPFQQNDRVFVPLRLIAEAYGAGVKWDEATQGITITSLDTEVKMNLGAKTYTVNGEAKEMDVEPVTVSDRTFVPIRAVSEALGKSVKWKDGLIVISDIDQDDITDAEFAEITEKLEACPVPEKTVLMPLNKGEKFFPNQLDVFAVTASDNDGNLEAGAVDCDMDTRWSAYGPNTLVVDLGSEQEVTGVAIAMWKGAERIYPFTIEYSSDGENWTQALAKTQNSGKTENMEEYPFSETVKARYIRYSGDGATDLSKNYCHISEIAILGTAE